MENIEEYLQIAFAVIGLASAIAAITPNPKDDGIVKVLNGLLNAFAMNIGNAKNKDQ